MSLRHLNKFVFCHYDIKTLNELFYNGRRARSTDEELGTTDEELGQRTKRSRRGRLTDEVVGDEEIIMLAILGRGFFCRACDEEMPKPQLVLSLLTIIS